MTERSLTRRQALAGALAAGAAVTVPGARARRRRRLIVVGAGIAGLAAATDARSAGWDVVVLEAGPTVGGRIRTFRFPGGQVAEAGGEFIDGSHREMRGYARRFGLPLEDVYRSGSDQPACVYLGGKRRPDRERYNRAENRYDDALDRLSGSGLDRLSAADLLDRLDLAPGARAYLEQVVIRDDYTAEAADLSLLFVVRTWRQPVRQPERYRVRGGNDQVPAALADRLGGRVQLGTAVTAIAQDDDGVTVSAAGESLRADACVLATPLPAIRDIALSPAPPTALSGAIADVRYGAGVKVALRYPDRPWRRQGFNGDTRTDLGIGTAWEATDAQPGHGGVLLTYTVGDQGARAAALDDDERVRAAAADVASIYPGAEPVDAQSAAWPQTYVAFAPGQVVPYAAALRRIEGRTILAGEHVSELSGYMEGAARSGRRAARLLNALR